MKSILQVCFVGSILFHAGMVSAQPTLTAHNSNPVVGDKFTGERTAAFSPGAAGVNQTWDFSALVSTGKDSNTVVTVASTTNGSSFPTSSIAIHSGSFDSYYKTSVAAFQHEGNSGGSNVQPYSDPEDMLRFPFTYNNSYTDNYYGTYTSNTTFYRMGKVTVTADGYGTLILPNGTYHNVLRIHLLENSRDSCNVSGSSSVSPFAADEYLWYLPGNHSAVASTVTITSSAGTQSGGGYINNIKVGIEEETLLHGFSLYPNPANGAGGQIKFELMHAGNLGLTILNSLGQQVGIVQQLSGMQGENTFALNTAILPEGIYFVKLAFESKEIYTQRLLIAE